MKGKGVILLLAMMFIVSACASGVNKPDLEPDNTDESPGYIGYVVNKEEGRILVVDGIAVDYSATGGMNPYYSAAWYSSTEDLSEVEIGQKVGVWSEGEMLTSYPGQGQADHVSIIQTEQPVGAILSQSEAIRKALASDLIKDYEVPIITGVTYDAGESSWLIEVTRNNEEKIVGIKVADKD
ncbi:MAG: YobA family protein [Candidatus Pristimantibacillus sp.]